MPAMVELARTLERQRNEARAALAAAEQRAEGAVAECDRLKDGLAEIAATGMSSRSRDYMVLPRKASRILAGEVQSKMAALVEAHMKAHQDTIAQRATAIRERDEARKDTARLDWVQLRKPLLRWDMENGWYVRSGSTPHADSSIRAAIDAALAAKSEGGERNL